ncbi:MAG: hypothetical protein D6748_15335 [Calditrichaeota bacterium]|nr:MAG: hypothetical protein D6748_15335 [Calditrichota bacterium]
MDFLDAWIAPPRADHVLIAKYFIIIVSTFFIPYISIQFGSTLFALGFSFRGKREENPLFWKFGQDIAETLLGGAATAFFLGILPVLTFAVSFGQILYGTEFNVGGAYLFTLVSLVLALFATQLFKKSFQKRDTAFTTHLFWGVAALLLQHLAIYGFVSSMSVVLFPEEWLFLKYPIVHPFDWNVVARLGMFMNRALAITGLAIIFFFFRWMGGKSDMDERYRDYVKKFGGGVALGFTMAQTLFMIWYLATLPIVAKATQVYMMGVINVIVLLIVAYTLYFFLADSRLKLATHASVLFLVFLFLFEANDHYARENALQYQNYELAKIDEEIRLEIEKQRMLSGGGEEASAALGEQIFNQKCSACHRFEQKLVGPAYLDVLPKYQGDIEKLSQFILNPVKVNPNLPMMPNQGLKPVEAKSAAMFLLKRYEELTQQQ